MTEKELCQAIATLSDVYMFTDMTNKEYLQRIKDIETAYLKTIYNKKQ